MLDRLDRAEGKGLRFGGGVGYDSEAAFGRPFKKATGLVPGDWREVRRTARIASSRAPAHVPSYPANHAADPTHHLGVSLVSGTWTIRPAACFEPRPDGSEIQWRLPAPGLPEEEGPAAQTL
jgi:hypothetical protein